MEMTMRKAFQALFALTLIGIASSLGGANAFAAPATNAVAPTATTARTFTNSATMNSATAVPMHPYEPWLKTHNRWHKGPHVGWLRSHRWMKLPHISWLKNHRGTRPPPYKRP